MNTGDLIFFKKYDGWWILGKLIAWWTQSPFIHVGMILKDPKFLGLKGTFIWQAEPLGGVTITHFKSHRKFWIRKYVGTQFDTDKLEEIFKITNGKPYDKNPFDWIEVIIGKDFIPQRTNAFWCSALVGCILTKLGIFNNNADWDLMSPGYLATIDLDCYDHI